MLSFLFLCAVDAASSPGASLRLCRELNYECVLSHAARTDLRVPPDAPLNADQQLVNRFLELSKHPEINQTCLFHWKNLVCSYLFVVSDERPPCSPLCDNFSRHCKFALPIKCATDANSSLCTNYAELTGLCANKRQLPSASSSHLHAQPPFDWQQQQQPLPQQQQFFGDARRRQTALSILVLMFAMNLCY